MFRDNLVPVQVVVTLYIREDANVNEVIEDMDYDFVHPDILDTEIREVNTEI